MSTSHKGMSIAERRQEIRDNLAGSDLVLAIGGDGATRYKFGLPTCRECGDPVNNEGRHTVHLPESRVQDHTADPDTSYFALTRSRTFDTLKEAEAFSEGVAANL